MNASHLEHRKFLRPTALLLSTLLTFPFFAGLASQPSEALLPPVDNTVSGLKGTTGPATSPEEIKGLNNKQKLVLLGGAAALFYLYQRHKNKQGHGAEGQYYLSSNGRVYYRDAQHQVHWVSPPRGGIQVPQSEAQQYRDFQGYDGRNTGRDLRGLGRD